MTSGFDEVSLALFTALSPAGAVAFIVLAVVRIFTKDSDEAIRIDRIIALPFSVCLIGFIASATHLGTPANALHVFGGIGRSPLSNEVFAAVVFLFLVGAYWMAAFKQYFPAAIAKPWLFVSCIAAIAFIACTAVAYTVDTVPTWDTLYTPVNLLLSALLVGPLMGLLFMQMARIHCFLGEAANIVVSSMALVSGTIILELHRQSLDTISNNEIIASSLAPHYGSVITLHLVFGIAGILCAILSLRISLKPRTVIFLRVLACALVLFAAFITRLVFYRLHMTLGF